MSSSCYKVPNAEAYTYTNENIYVKFRTNRRDVFSRYRNEIVLYGLPQVHYDGADDLLQPAYECAQRIIAGECAVYALAERVRGRLNFGVSIAYRDLIDERPTRFHEVPVAVSSSI